MSVKPSWRSNASATCGAMQMTGSLSRRTLVTSGGGSAASELLPAILTAPTPPKPAAPAHAILARKARRLCTIGMESLLRNQSKQYSGLHLAFELVEKAPIRVLGDQRLRAR